jgi:hypothetical protein
VTLPWGNGGGTASSFGLRVKSLRDGVEDPMSIEIHLRQQKSQGTHRASQERTGLYTADEVRQVSTDEIRKDLGMSLGQATLLMKTTTQ